MPDKQQDSDKKFKTAEERKRYAREYYKANKERINAAARQKRREALGLGHFAFIKDD